MPKTQQSVTKADILALRNDFLTELRDFRVTVNSEFKSVYEQFDVVNDKIDDLQEDMSKVRLAVIDLTGTDRTVRHLVRELKGQGIKLDESKIF